jgi:hypothetical protein
LSLPPAIHSYTLICIVFPTSFAIDAVNDATDRKISLSHYFISSFKQLTVDEYGVSKTENIAFRNQYIIRLLYHSNKRQKLRFEVCFIVKKYF